VRAGTAKLVGKLGELDLGQTSVIVGLEYKQGPMKSGGCPSSGNAYTVT
jgi:hypothetical protein